MTTIKIYHSAKMKNPSHKKGQHFLYFDDIICLVSRRMRKMKQELIQYEKNDQGAIMKFKEIQL